MERPSCRTCPYWESGDRSAWPCERLDFWQSVVGISDAKAELLATHHVTSDAALDRELAKGMKLSKAAISHARRALEHRRKYEHGVCRIRARGANGTWPNSWQHDWCGEHPDFPAWIASRKATRLPPETAKKLADS